MGKERGRDRREGSFVRSNSGATAYYYFGSTFPKGEWTMDAREEHHFNNKGTKQQTRKVHRKRRARSHHPHLIYFVPFPSRHSKTGAEPGRRGDLLGTCMPACIHSFIHSLIQPTRKRKNERTNARTHERTNERPKDLKEKKIKKTRKRKNLEIPQPHGF